MSEEVVDPFVLPAGRPDGGKKVVRVLSLSGGGYRGLFSAQVLNRLTEQAGGSGKGARLDGCFDLISGTSIGGILGAGLSAGVMPAQLVSTLKRHGPKIFPQLRLRRLRKYVGRAPYDPSRLREAIKSVMPKAETTPLAQHQRPLLLTAVNWTSSKLHLLGSGATPYADRLGLSLMDAMLATSAAPSFFPPHAVAHHTFVDGGLTANAPDLLALQCARQMWPHAEILMLSVGTANPLHGRDPSALPNRAFGWARPVIELVMNAQEMWAVQECARALGPHRYLRMNMNPSDAQARRLDFDIANDKSTDLLLDLADHCVADLTLTECATLASILR